MTSTPVNGSYEQLTLDLFAPPTFEALLQTHQQHKLQVSVSTRLKKSWYVKIQPYNGGRILTIPAYLQSAPESIKQALIEWSLLPNTGNKERRKAVRKKKCILEKAIHAHIDSLQLDSRTSRAVDPAHYERHTVGCMYDLREIFNYLNTLYFDNAIEGYIRWGRYASATSYQTKRHDARGNAYNLITIAGVYDHPQTPDFAINGVVYHEMLHCLIEPYTRNGRRVIHGAEFVEREKHFAHYHQWRAWEKKHLHRHLRYLKRAKRNALRTR
ncbi:MAG: hypothetical protein GF398_18645 [Chitinivibrionales bacterium]|nr:hypothetical protein [Chitinivibrionales bacterium]